MWLWVKHAYPKWNPDKWNQRLKPVVPWWVYVDPYRAHTQVFIESATLGSSYHHENSVVYTTTMIYLRLVLQIGSKALGRSLFMGMLLDALGIGATNLA